MKSLVALLCLVSAVGALGFPRSVRAHPVCGEHPLKSLATELQIQNPFMKKSEMVSALKNMGEQSPELWLEYQGALSLFNECILMSEGGHFG